MSSSKAAKSKPTDAAIALVSPGSVVCGAVHAVNADGSFTVEFRGNELGPLRAMTIVDDLSAGDKVLVAFESGDPTRPVVLGLVQDRVRTRNRTIHLKAAHIVLEASEGLSIKCGEASVETSSRDGKLMLKGRDVLSRASRTNKVQGSTVRLN